MLFPALAFNLKEDTEYCITNVQVSFQLLYSIPEDILVVQN